MSIYRSTYLSLSMNTSSSRSSNADASAPRCEGGIRGWSFDTSASDVSFRSGLYTSVNTIPSVAYLPTDDTYPWVCDGTHCLNLDHPLCKLDTTDPDPHRRCIPSPEYARFDGRHNLPCGGIGGVLDPEDESTLESLNGGHSARKVRLLCCELATCHTKQ